MDILLKKILGGIALWLCMVVFGLLPIFYNKFKTSTMLISLSNCFCGGLFIAIGLIHILPESHEMLDLSHSQPDSAGKGKLLQGSEDEGGLQYSYLICLLSYSVILLLDKVVFNNSDLIENNPENQGNPQTLDLNRSMIRMSVQDSENKIEDNFKERVCSKYKMALRMSRNSNLRDSFSKSRVSELDEQNRAKKAKLIVLKNEEFEGTEEIENEPQFLEEKLIQKDAKKTSKDKKRKTKSKSNLGKSDDEEDNLLKVKLPENFRINNNLSVEHGNNHEHHTHNLIRKNDSIVTCIVLLVAMGIHGFFALLAFGLEKSEKGTVNLFIALIAHKWSEAMTVGRDFGGCLAGRDEPVNGKAFHSFLRGSTKKDRFG